MTQVRVNIRTAVNASTIRREKRDGRDVIIVPSATLPDGVVMNKIRYPAAAIEASYKTLEGKPAPLGHPTLNGKFVSASDPQGLVRSFVGAWNENVRRKDGRVFLDKVIDVEFAGQSEGGKSVLNAIEAGDPIHTSTGLLATLREVKNADDGAEFEAEDMHFDHDAILLDEEGAATPAQGVGMLVNRAEDAQGNAIEVINSVIGDDIERDLYWSADSLMRAVERSERVPLIERFIELMKVIVRGSPTEATNQTDEEASMDKAQFDELSGKVDALATAISGIGEGIGTAVANALKPVTDQLQANADAQKAKDDAARDELVNKIVEAGILDEPTAKAADLAVLNALAEKNKPNTAFRVNGAAPKSQGDKPKFDAPKGE